VETRKIQRTGHSTFTVSLPKDWVMNGGLSKGERMMLTLKPDSSIVLNVPGKVRNPREFTIVGVEDPDSLFRKVLGLYLAGFHTIKFRFDEDEGPRLKADLRRILSSITGLEVMEETGTELEVKDLFDSSKYTPAKAMERLHTQSRAMVQPALDAVRGHGEALEDMEDRARNVQWLNWLVTRQYNLVLYDVSYTDILGITPVDGANHVIVCKALERIADHSMRICRSVKGLEGGVVNESVVTLLDGAMDSFRRKDREKALEVIHSARGMRWVNPHTEAARAGDVIMWTTVADSFNRIITYIDEIAETAYYTTFMTRK